MSEPTRIPTAYAAQMASLSAVGRSARDRQMRRQGFLAGASTVVFGTLGALVLVALWL